MEDQQAVLSGGGAVWRRKREALPCSQGKCVPPTPVLFFKHSLIYTYCGISCIVGMLVMTPHMQTDICNVLWCLVSSQTQRRTPGMAVLQTEELVCLSLYEWMCFITFAKWSSLVIIAACCYSSRLGKIIPHHVLSITSPHQAGMWNCLASYRFWCPGLCQCSFVNLWM